MATVFTCIIDGELPATFVWRDERCVGFMSINPLAHGHVLVVPMLEVDQWIDASADLVAHLFEVTRVIGVALRQAFDCARVGVIVAGYEVPHAHIHVVPTETMDQLLFTNAAAAVPAEELEAAAAAIRAELRALGRAEVTDR